MWHKPCRTFNPWCLCIKTRCLCTHGLPSTDSWQTSLGLGNMSWYSAHILICIIKPVVLISWFGNWERFLRWKHRHLRVFHPMLSISSYTKSLKTGLANGSALTITGYCSELLVVQNTTSHGYLDMGAFKNAYEIFNWRTFKFSYVNKIHIYQCKVFWVEFQWVTLKFLTNMFPIH